MNAADRQAEGSGSSDGGGQSGDEVQYFAGLKDKLSAVKDKIEDKVTPEQYKGALKEYLDPLPKLSEQESMEQPINTSD